ncbi:polyphosphate--glucose phosphotransferase [Buchananella hordeovulneris]|uniref:Polyphosphate glucokinase n=1 Tax=Buchananella hordeovulneris TaxID=52770 RepID=A0A1Q5PX73_9ACTO|nr:ROK family protein [Buchananella hordeovulneris]MDO5081053.1 ROK family protein [Buchananella hordeovulneris]OKL52198.1 polyphosphate glucokinase [Buchananella hordeovulneris]RRD44863.1 ROK family protein [Buchananella hordeovulneris]RRD51748.1 ROK family protein [Buchananella hordeovulneris]
MALAFGIDIGGSGIKGAPVDLQSGFLAAPQVRIDTPQPSTPAAVTEVCREVIAAFELPPGTPIGITFPGPIKRNVVRFVANLDQSWVGVDVAAQMRQTLGTDVVAVNDADAAGFAEVAFGAGAGVDGLIVVTTLGTGIGSALIYNGVLIPCSELGHVELDGVDAETRAAASVRTAENLDFPAYAQRLQRYYSHIEMLFSPDLFIVGGGVSAHHEQFLPLLDLQTPIVPAQLRNEAGIVGGAALAAALSA